MSRAFWTGSFGSWGSPELTRPLNQLICSERGFGDIGADISQIASHELRELPGNGKTDADRAGLGRGLLTPVVPLEDEFLFVLSHPMTIHGMAAPSILTAT